MRIRAKEMATSVPKNGIDSSQKTYGSNQEYHSKTKVAFAT